MLPVESSKIRPAMYPGATRSPPITGLSFVRKRGTIHDLISLRRVTDSVPMAGSGFDKSGMRVTGKDSSVSETCHTLFSRQLKPGEKWTQRVGYGNFA